MPPQKLLRQAPANGGLAKANLRESILAENQGQLRGQRLMSSYKDAACEAERAHSQIPIILFTTKSLQRREKSVCSDSRHSWQILR